MSALHNLVHSLSKSIHVKCFMKNRLNLPGKIVENGKESASYDVEKGWNFL